MTCWNEIFLTSPSNAECSGLSFETQFPTFRVILFVDIGLIMNDHWAHYGWSLGVLWMIKGVIMDDHWAHYGWSLGVLWTIIGRIMDDHKVYYVNTLNSKHLILALNKFSPTQIDHQKRFVSHVPVNGRLINVK